jgi:Plasmid pRiA4b ORF-3-like protein
MNELDSQGLSTPRSLVAPLALYQLQLTLAEIRPPIWRRLLVPNDITLRWLHNIIQEVGGWENYHLHEFAMVI